MSCGELCRCARERRHVRDASHCRFSKLIDSMADMSSSRETTPSSSKSSVLNAWPVEGRGEWRCERGGVHGSGRVKGGRARLADRPLGVRDLRFELLHL